MRAAEGVLYDIITMCVLLYDEIATRAGLGGLRLDAGQLPQQVVAARGPAGLR